MRDKKPIEKLLGMKCISCAHFSCEKFNDLESRLAYGRREFGGGDFGSCSAIGADDAVGCHLVKHEQKNQACRFTSAGHV